MVVLKSICYEGQAAPLFCIICCKDLQVKEWRDQHSSSQHLAMALYSFGTWVTQEHVGPCTLGELRGSPKPSHWDLLLITFQESGKIYKVRSKLLLIIHSVKDVL